MLTHIGLAIATFVITNIDDLLILSIYFANGRFKTRSIVAGQYTGIIVLVLVSLSGIILGEFLDKRWISLLGIFPIFLGIKDLVKSKHDENEDSDQSTRTRFQFINVALVTIANGGDNIGVYTPLFANIDSGYVVLYIGIFMVLTAVWCLLGYWFVSHKTVKGAFAKYGKLVLPFFLIGLGLFILKEGWWDSVVK